MVVVLLGTVVWTSYQTSRDTAVSFVAKLAQQSLSHMEDELRDHLDPVVKQTEWTAELITSRRPRGRRSEDIAQILTAAMAATPQVTALVFFGRDLEATRAFRGSSGEPWHIEIGPASNSDFAKKALHQAMQTKRGFWNEILYSEERRRSFVNYIKPVWRGETFVGVVLAAISLNELSDLVIAISSQFNGTAFILDNKSQVIAHPNLTSNHPDLSKRSPTVEINRVGDFVLPRFLSAETRQLHVDRVSKNLEVREALVAGQRYVFVFTKLKGYGAAPWTIGGYVDAETIEAPLLSVRNSLQIGLVIIVLGALLAIYLGHSIARLVKTASDGISRIAELEVNDVQELPRSRIAELDAQARAFNNMLQALRWFSLYVPKSLVNRLIRRGSQVVASEQKKITLLFSDLAGFTSISEQMSAEETAAYLNHHFGLLAACVEAEGGTIDKFMGDALMAFWGAPDDQPDQAKRAARAACAMAAAVHADNAARMARGDAPVRFRVGLHCGPAVVGNIGAPERMNYTVVGDTVNTAQRMEQLGKEVAPNAETVILATENVVAELDKDTSVEAVGALAAKGKSKPIEAFRLGS